MTAQLRRAGLVGCGLLSLVVACRAVSATSDPLPPPKLDASLAAEKGEAVAIVAGGCFWGVEAVYRHVRGVTRAVSGYAGGSAATARYEIVSDGRSGHAESVEVTYDPSQITYGQILRVFFSVAHDPTERNRQGPDVGPQYRSAIFFRTSEQERIARAYIAQLDEARVLRRPIATEVAPLDRFYAAEEYHQDYVRLNPSDMYVRINDAPKIEALKRGFPELFQTRR